MASTTLTPAATDLPALPLRTGTRLTTVLVRSGLVCAAALVAGLAHAQEEGWLDTITDFFARPGEEVTPSHVYQATRDVIAEIRVLRAELGTDDYPPEAELQEDRAPIHVYAKTLEVLTKVSRVQRRLGLSPATVGQIPIREVVPRDVLGSVGNILGELRRIKTQMVIEVPILSLIHI